MVKKEFQLTHTFKNVSKLEVDKYAWSLREEHFNIPWRIAIIRNDEKMQIQVACQKHTNDNVSAGVEGEFTIKLSNSSGKSTSKSSRLKRVPKGGFGSVRIVWKAVQDEYLIDDSIIIEATVKITKMTGISKKPLKCFDQSKEKFSDVILAVGDQKFFVLRKFLASHSTYFEAMFLGNFDEADKSEVTLRDIDSGDFQNLLEVLYGEPAIDEDTVEGILHLAHMYDMPIPIRKCEEFLIQESEKSMKDQLEIAKKYQLEKLKTSCLSKINTADEIKAAMACDLADMDQTVVQALLRKSVALL